MTLDEIEHRCDRIIPQLKCRCEGLLEVHDMHDRHWEDRYLVSTDDEMAPNNVGSDEGDEDDEDDEVESAESSTHGIYSEDPLKLNWKVAYLYRTFKDFLKTAQIQAKFERSTFMVPGISSLNPL
jgi:hypothetical protein